MDLAMHEYFRVWVSAILLALSLGWTIFWSIMMSRKSAAKGEQDKLAGQLAELRESMTKDEKADTAEFGEVKSRLQKVEDQIRHLPTKEQVHSLELAMTELKGDLKEVATSIRPLALTVERINDFLMDQSKR